MFLQMNIAEREALAWQFTAAKLQLRNMEESPKFVKWEDETVERQKALVSALEKLTKMFPKE